MRRAILALVLGLAFASCATVPRAADEGGSRWIRAESEHLSLETDLGEKEARTLAHDLENWRLAMTAALFKGARPPRQKLEIIALGNRELQAIDYTLLGTFDDLDYIGPVLVLGASEDSDRERLMRHELAHAVISENLPTAPRWLHEGLATLLATAEMDDDTGVVTWGAVATPQQTLRNIDLAPSSRLLDLRRWQTGETWRLERSSGYFVRMLATKHPAELACLIGHLGKAQPYERSFAACFPDRSHLGWEYTHSQHEADSEIGTIRIRPQSVTVATRVMSDADVHAVLAMLHHVLTSRMQPKDSRLPEVTASLRQHRSRALELEPANVLAASLFLTSDDSDGDPKGELTNRLVRAHPDDWRAWLWRADLTSTPPDQKKAALERVAAMAPSRREVLQLQAYDAVVAGDFASAERFAREELALAPGYQAGRILLFVALERQQKCQEIKALMASDPAFEEEIMRQLDDPEFERPSPACVARPARGTPREAGSR